MRSAALIALLPFLASVATAAPRPPASSDIPVRKSLSFGPPLSHARFNTYSAEDAIAFSFSYADAKDLATHWLRALHSDGHGDNFYIRDDSYTDKSTGITHIFAKQLINGLEVSDGDVNINIDSNQRIISMGSSFVPDDQVALDDASVSGSTQEPTLICKTLVESLNAHKAALAGREDGESTGPWALVKSAASLVIPGYFDAKVHKSGLTGDEAAKISKNIERIQHHLDAQCSRDRSALGTSGGSSLEPVDALLRLIPRISPQHESLAPLSRDDFVSTPHHDLKPKPAPNEPPTQYISGRGLAKAGILGDVKSRLMYTQTTEELPRLVWKLEVEMQHNWYEAYVDVYTGDTLRIVDWAHDYSWTNDAGRSLGPSTQGKGGKQKPLPTPPKDPKAKATYQVFPWGINDPTTGKLANLTEPWDTVASPWGWHQVPTKENPWASKDLPGQKAQGNVTTFFTTIGNNIIAHEDWEGQNDYLLNYRPVSKDLSFIYDYGEYEGLAPKEYIDFVVTQLFYTSNTYHDLVYRLGFDEIAGNFQLSNFGKGGLGQDPVIANAQDGSGYNNANFMTPPDGTSGRMRMYVWDTATPYRDGDVEAGIVIHELSHGLSTRITGGPANSGCLGWGEAGGMGEGWGDALATLIRQVEEHGQFKNGTDTYPMGSWAANRKTGIRNFVYSTNATVNPSTYKTLDKPGYWGVHAIGEVWAELLFVVSQRLIEKYGFSSTLFPPADVSKPNDYYTKTIDESVDEFGKPVPLVPKHGNTLAIQLIVDGLKLQPCRPSFFDARDAIIQADQIRTGGANGCLIWKAFAERGLGSDANVVGQTPWGGGVRNDGFQIPSKVCKD